ncbi:response regulator [Hwanghaeella grinnelliae]|uniref:Response regulator n=2 Tax=Hwanghaeella grinnelliae TaxID=2500179 RepID=A0A3S2Y3P9_9PROT|nr:response regulator [Hwanghaeella grinnelliae]
MAGVNLQPIIIVEDSDDDFEATERALKRDGPIANPLVRFDNGQDALDYMFNRPPYEDRAANPIPAIVLLDLNLPGVDGRQVLTELKNSEATQKIPVVIMTTSDDPRDVNSSYAKGANSYLRKPVALEDLFRTIQLFKEYWLSVAILPKVGE